MALGLYVAIVTCLSGDLIPAQAFPEKKLGASVEICANVGFGCDFVLASVDESSAHRISSRQASVFRANLCSKTVSHQVFPQNDGEISLK